MKPKIKEFVRNPEIKQIRVRLDYRTFITISSMSSLDIWLKRYPDAKVIES